MFFSGIDDLFANDYFISGLLSFPLKILRASPAGKQNKHPCVPSVCLSGFAFWASNQRSTRQRGGCVSLTDFPAAPLLHQSALQSSPSHGEGVQVGPSSSEIWKRFNNHGDRKSPKARVVGPLPSDLFMAYTWGLLTTYQLGWSSKHPFCPFCRWYPLGPVVLRKPSKTGHKQPKFPTKFAELVSSRMSRLQFTPTWLECPLFPWICSVLWKTS